MPTIKIGSYFATETRADGTRYTCLTYAAPDWLMQAVRDAHQGDFPNDWIYEECRAAADAIDEGSIRTCDDIHQHADCRVDVYTKNLYQWAAEFCNSDTFAAAEESADDIGQTSGSTVDRLATVQYCAIEHIAHVILDAYESNQGTEE